MSAPAKARDGLVVVKLGGRTQNDPSLPATLHALWRATNGRLVIVHGGGDQISALQRLRGEEPVFVGGRRVTTPIALELVRMVLSGLANKQLVSALTAVGAPAVGISGEDAELLQASVVDFASFGYTGTPSRVDATLVTTLLDARFLPVISPVATSDDPSVASALNVNGDDAAAAIAAALGARELFLMIDVAAVLDEHKQPIASLSLDEARAMVASGVAGGGMAAKLDACAVALTGGVSHVRIGDLAALPVAAAGTTVHGSAVHDSTDAVAVSH